MNSYVDIKALRKARKMTQEQVGILAGMSKSQVSRVESGQLGGPETYHRLLGALGYKMVVSFEDIRGGNELDKEYIISVLKVYYLCNKSKLGIDSIGLFGSFARDEAGPNSDIDLIVSFKKPDLFLYSEVSSQLEKVFGRHVDLISANAHHRTSFIEQIKKDVIYVS